MVLFVAIVLFFQNYNYLSKKELILLIFNTVAILVKFQLESKKSYKSLQMHTFLTIIYLYYTENDLL